MAHFIAFLVLSIFLVGADLWVPKTWSTWADSLVMLRFAGVLKQGLWRS
jgi:hypothetical protein